MAGTRGEDDMDEKFDADIGDVWTHTVGPPPPEKSPVPAWDWTPAEPLRELTDYETSELSRLAPMAFDDRRATGQVDVHEVTDVVAVTQQRLHYTTAGFSVA